MRIKKKGLYVMKTKDVVLDEIIFIEEERYQQIKKILCKSNDYFTENELEKIDVILT
jgi:hypothetical protein